VSPASSPWLPHGFSFLSGFPEPVRKRRVLVPFQVCADESEGPAPGTRNHFVMAGLIAHSLDWALFSDEWRACLVSGPRHLDYFKMKEAAGKPSGQFFGWSTAERDEKVRNLARIINRYVKIVTWSIIDLEAHAQTWAKRLPKPNSDPYFWPFQNTILATCFTLWDAGVREKFEVIFDNNLIFGTRAKAWYPMVREVGVVREPEASTILPADTLFRDDIDFVPLQAADLYAWTLRKANNDPSYTEFHWLLDELRNVKTTDYSQYYDLERMQSVMNMMDENIRNKNVSDELLKKFVDHRRSQKKDS
jgi:hypothetical protein